MSFFYTLFFPDRIPTRYTVEARSDQPQRHRDTKVLVRKNLETGTGLFVRVANEPAIIAVSQPNFQTLCVSVFLCFCG